jgi:hypothetical protein
MLIQAPISVLMLLACSVGNISVPIALEARFRRKNGAVLLFAVCSLVECRRFCSSQSTRGIGDRDIEMTHDVNDLINMWRFGGCDGVLVRVGPGVEIVLRRRALTLHGTAFMKYGE